MSVFKGAICAVSLFLAMTAETLAYGGPGAAITLIGSLIGVGLAIFASLFYVIAWPLRRMLKKRKAADETADAPPGTQIAAANEPAGAETATETATDTVRGR